MILRRFFVVLLCLAAGRPLFADATAVTAFNEWIFARTYAFVVGGAPSSHLYLRAWDGLQWRWSDHGSPAWGLLPYNYRERPTVVSFAESGVRKTYAFVRDARGELSVRFFDGTTWRWASQGKPAGVATIFSPAAITFFEGERQRIYVFAVTVSGRLAVNYWDGLAWRWADLGSPPSNPRLTCSSAVTYQQGGSRRIEVFTAANDGHLYLVAWDGSSWQWLDQGPPVGAEGVAGCPSAVTFEQDGLRKTYVFAGGDDRHLHVNYFDGAKWRWADQGKPPASASWFRDLVAVSTHDSGIRRIFAFVLGTDKEYPNDFPGVLSLAVNAWNGWSWSWADRGPVMTIRPREFHTLGKLTGAIARSGGSKSSIDVFVADSNPVAVARHTWDGTSWRWTASQVPERQIPLRFVQFVAPGDQPLGLPGLWEQIEGANAIFAAAGIQFTLGGLHTVEDSTFAVFGATDTYTWPNPPSSASPIAFNRGCAVPTPGGPETREMALLRAGSYCAADGEIVVFTGNTLQSRGTYPWEANAVIMERKWMQPGSRAFAHELGHYLGLPHSFRGAGLSYDLGNPNALNPQTGTAARMADYWDLVYKPRDLPPATGANRYFGSRPDAETVSDASLRAIQGNAAWAMNPLGFVCSLGAGNCPAGVADRSLRLAVPTTEPEYEDCNTTEPDFSAKCACVTAPDSCEVLFTGDLRLKGLGLLLPGGEIGAPRRGGNVMSYNYTPGFAGDEWSLSQSQLEQIRRVLQHDIASSWFAQTTGRRPLLGSPP